MKKRPNWWSKIRQLPTADLLLLARGGVCVFLIKVGLKALKFSWFKHVFNFFLKTKTTKNHSEDWAKKVVWSVQTVAHVFPFSVVCLPQALAVKYLLRHDHRYLLKIGVSTQNQSFSAHAWVEKDGILIIGDTPQTQYVPIWTWSETTAIS